MKFKSAIATPRRPDAARNIFNAEAQRTQSNAENNVMSRVVGGLPKNLCAHRVSVVKNPATEDHRDTMNTEKSVLEFNARTVVREILSPLSRCESLRAPRLRVKPNAFREFSAVVPEGHPTIAQRFNAGLRQRRKRVPEGRQKTGGRRRVSVVPPGLAGIHPLDPALKRWAIFTLSLRDKRLPEFPKGINFRTANRHPPKYALFTCGFFRSAADASARMMRPVSST